MGINYGTTSSEITEEHIIYRVKFIKARNCFIGHSIDHSNIMSELGLTPRQAIELLSVTTFVIYGLHLIPRTFRTFKRNDSYILIAVFGEYFRS